jgi:hypothetical protein
MWLEKSNAFTLYRAGGVPLTVSSKVVGALGISGADGSDGTLANQAVSGAVLTSSLHSDLLQLNVIYAAANSGFGYVARRHPEEAFAFSFVDAGGCVAIKHAVSG